MPGLVFAPPIVVAVAMGLFGSGSKRQWSLVIAGVGAVEALIAYFLVPLPELGGVVIFSFLVPWLVVISYVALSPYPRRPVLVATFIPFVYVGGFVLSVIVGVNMGMLRV